MSASFDLERFVTAQAPVYDRVLAELRAGVKQSHWMWFIFPQIAGLGHSAMSQRYAIASRREAAGYLHHALLGPRLRECTQLVCAVSGKSIDSIFGWPDTMKFQSSMTLFAKTSDQNREFIEAIDRYFGGQFDQATLDRLNTPRDANTE